MLPIITRIITPEEDINNNEKVTDLPQTELTSNSTSKFTSTLQSTMSTTNQNSSFPYVSDTIPLYIYKYPHVTLAVQTFHHIVNEWQPDTLEGKYELEARFGLWTGQYFKNGVSKKFIEKVLYLFEQCPHWFKITDWEDTHDYYFDETIMNCSQYKSSSEWPRSGNHYSNAIIRITTHFVSDPLSGKKSITTEYIKKISKRKLNLKFVDGTNGKDRLSNDLYDLRVCLNYEETLSKEDIPDCMNPTSVRLKTRKSFYYKSDNIPSYDPVWKFDITRSWLGESKSEAEHKQKANESTNYELELECLNPTALMCLDKHDSFYVMCSMLLKMSDLLNSQVSFRWDPIQQYVK